MKLLTVKNVDKEQGILDLDLQSILISLGTTTLLNSLTKNYIKNLTNNILNKLYVEKSYMYTTDKQECFISGTSSSYFLNIVRKSFAYIYLLNPDRYVPKKKQVVYLEKSKNLNKDEMIAIAKTGNIGDISQHLPDLEYGTYIHNFKDNTVLIYSYKKVPTYGDNNQLTGYNNTLNLYFIGKNHMKHYRKYNNYLSYIKKSSEKKNITTLSTLHYDEEKCSFYSNTVQSKYPDTFIGNSSKILTPVKFFLSKKDLFNKREWQYNFNILLTGFAGTGKTSLVKIIQTYINDKLNQDINLYSFKSNSLSKAINALYSDLEDSESKKIKMVLIEEVDEVMKNEDSRQTLMQFLDGDLTPNNCIIICTSNYPNRLDKRIYDRFNFVEEIRPLSRKGAERLCDLLEWEDYSILDNIKVYDPEFIEMRLKELGVHNISNTNYDSVMDYEDVVKLLEDNNIKLSIIDKLLYKIDCYIPRVINNTIRVQESRKLGCKNRTITITDNNTVKANSSALIGADISNPTHSSLPKISFREYMKQTGGIM